ncbi:hypothetical protein TRAPUB_1396 [Trametes pubescens]|uniref:Uncharacterized protein n=1 Tax=Trametes pubescens TaxID=154538 RepID=A0A1M2VJG2_TRAPU|nr:hypothetical protein TRAPUB_1396 [Trametes pubescens]
MDSPSTDPASAGQASYRQEPAGQALYRQEPQQPLHSQDVSRRKRRLSDATAHAFVSGGKNRRADEYLSQYDAENTIRNIRWRSGKPPLRFPALVLVQRALHPPSPLSPTPNHFLNQLSQLSHRRSSIRPPGSPLVERPLSVLIRSRLKPTGGKSLPEDRLSKSSRSLRSELLVRGARGSKRRHVKKQCVKRQRVERRHIKRWRVKRRHVKRRHVKRWRVRKQQRDGKLRVKRRRVGERRVVKRHVRSRRAGNKNTSSRNKSKHV